MRVTATAAGGVHAVAESARTSAIAARPLTLVRAPEVTGTTQVGSTLITEPGVWSVPLTDFVYQWRRCSGADLHRYPGRHVGLVLADRERSRQDDRRAVRPPTRRAGPPAADSAPTEVVGLP